MYDVFNGILEPNEGVSIGKPLHSKFKEAAMAKPLFCRKMRKHFVAEMDERDWQTTIPIPFDKKWERGAPDNLKRLEVLLLQGDIWL